MARKPDYLQILARLRTLAYNDSPLLTAHERDDVRGWPKKVGKDKARQLWRLVRERSRPTVGIHK